MKESEAIDIIRLLAAGFHRESIEPETIQLWVEVITPMDAELATSVTMGWIKNQDTFPSISQYRHAYHIERRRISQPRIPATPVSDTLDLEQNEVPSWVVRWLRRFKVVSAIENPRQRAEFEDWRVFPEQTVGETKYRDDPRYTSEEAQELGLMPEGTWLEDARTATS